MASFLDYEHGISVIDAHHHRPKLAAFYLIIEGNQAAFIDTGTSHSIPDALDVLARKGLTPEQVAYVIPTHAHLDHAGGAGAMMRRFPKAKLVAHPKGARHLIDPDETHCRRHGGLRCQSGRARFRRNRPRGRRARHRGTGRSSRSISTAANCCFSTHPDMRAITSASWTNRVGGFLPAIPSGCLTVSWIRTTASSFFPPPRRCSSSPRHCTHPSTVSWTC